MSATRPRPMQIRGPIATARAGVDSARRCTTEGCTRYTAGGKPWCSWHLGKSAHAARIARLWQGPLTLDHPKTVELLGALEGKAPDLPHGWHASRGLADVVDFSAHELGPVLDFLEEREILERETFYSASKSRLKCYRLTQAGRAYLA